MNAKQNILAKTIRATIGLNKVQAKANLNYYQHVKNTLLENNPGMKESTAQKKAQEAAAKYAAKQHRQRAGIHAAEARER